MAKQRTQSTKITSFPLLAEDSNFFGVTTECIGIVPQKIGLHYKFAKHDQYVDNKNCVDQSSSDRYLLIGNARENSCSHYGYAERINKRCDRNIWGI